MTTHQPSSDTQTLTDVHDMVVVHRAFRRELAIIPRLVRAVPAGDTRRAAVVADHARLCLQGWVLVRWQRPRQDSNLRPPD